MTGRELFERWAIGPNGPLVSEGQLARKKDGRYVKREVNLMLSAWKWGRAAAYTDAADLAEENIGIAPKGGSMAALMIARRIEA